MPNHIVDYEVGGIHFSGLRDRSRCGSLNRRTRKRFRRVLSAPRTVGSELCRAHRSLQSTSDWPRSSWL
jgi:hypothetical protein